MYFDESHRPPPESGDAEEDERASWDWGETLIECSAYMINVKNHTTAYCQYTTREGSREEIQVTFCLAPPPHISYFCIAFTSGKRTQFASEPLIVAMAGNFALICIPHGCILQARPIKYDFFVYHVPTRVHELPRLVLLPHPEPDLFPCGTSCYFPLGEVGILRYRTRIGRNQQLPFTPPTPTLMLTQALARRPKTASITYTNNEEYDDCKMATICIDHEESGITHCDLFIYDSKTLAWTREPTVLPQELPNFFRSDRVITIAGTMVWVDLSQGMILCDLHMAPEEESPGECPRQLRYIRLPNSMQPPGTPSLSRDIAVVDGHIKFVNLEIHNSSPGMYSWTAATWSMSVDDSEFHKDGEVKSADIAPSDALDLKSFFVAHPTLSSHHGDILYLMAKASLVDRESIVIAVDMKNMKMERVAKYTMQREGSMSFAYMLTAISKYLAPPAGTPFSTKFQIASSMVASSHT
jgi:hypothetical protein